MCLVHDIVKNGPLTVMIVSDDPAECELLTPHHLLLLRYAHHLPPGVFVPGDCYIGRR